MNAPRIRTLWNKARGEITHKITREGTSAFLLMNDQELVILRDLINSALGGTQIDHSE
ncbi:hypothetical protein [Nocardia sp. R6R-6]|uniref:hypothetical protein n=1 Tax=Nocardia sp. R6R-6 TaxID=3459303 RepID=UPI00403DA650